MGSIFAGDGGFEQMGLGDDHFLSTVLDEVDGGFDLGAHASGRELTFGEIFFGFGNGEGVEFALGGFFEIDGDFIDASGLYSNPINKTDRSWMNVPFRLADDRLDKPFLAGAEARGLLNLKGHRSVGGMRASIYNAVDINAVNALVDYMAAFEKEHG